MVALVLPSAARTSAAASLLRWPSQRPQKGRQAVRDVTGEESWAGNDADFDRALAWTPGSFIFFRDLPHLVELPAVWCRVPLQGRDAHELGDDVVAALRKEGCPDPHLVIEGDLHVFAVWAIEPFRRPRRDAPDQNHYYWRKGLELWRNTAIKLSFALEHLGAMPLDPAAADALRLSFVPFPLPRTDRLRQVKIGFHEDPPQLLSTPNQNVDDFGDVATLRIADISKPLGRRHDGRLFATLGLDRPKGKKHYLKSALTLAALTTTAAGERHPAAIKIACAARWDGEDEEQILERLRDWAKTVQNDGRFPFRRGKGDELQLIAHWAFTRLKPGGPNKPGKAHKVTRTTRDLVAQAVVGFLKSVGGSWAGSKAALAKQAALWALEAQQPAFAPRTTLRRALADLKAAGELIHTVARNTATWVSSWVLRASPPPPTTPSSSPPTPAAAVEILRIPASAEASEPRVQKGKSTWSPASAPAALTDRGGPAWGRLPPAGWGVGRGEDPVPAPKPTKSKTPTPEFPVVEADADVDHNDDGLTRSPETGRPRQRRLRLVTATEGTSRRRRRRGPRVGVPPLTEELLAQLADVAPSLDPVARRALLERAHADLRPRPKVLADVAGAIRRRATRLRRLNKVAAPTPEDVVAERLRFAREQEREKQEQAALQAASSLDEDGAATSFKQLLAGAGVAGTPLHLRAFEQRLRRLHDEGLSLIPLKPRSKQPAITWTEWQSAQTPLSLLRRKAKDLGDDAGLAIICGRVSGIVAVDLDDQSAVDWAKTHLPLTSWRTKTARGEHWFYRHPEVELPATQPPWVGQLQGSGRYVVAPGSWHPDGNRYEALGDWGEPKEALPVFDLRWLLDINVLRANRQKILRGEP